MGIDVKRRKEVVDKERAEKSHKIERRGKTNGEKAMKAGVEMDVNERLAKARRELETKNHKVEVERFNKKTREITEKHKKKEEIYKRSHTVGVDIKRVSEQLKKEEITKK